MKWIIAIFGLLFFFTFANAEIYKWVDEKGTVHFTEDPSTIPEKYRDKTDRRTTEEDSMTMEDRIMEKQKTEDAAKQQLIEDRRTYERLLKEEEIKRERRQRKIGQDEEKIRAEKEEKARKLEEIKKQEEQGPVYENVTCPRCNGTGIIWKKSRVPKRIGHVQTWDEIQIATKCEDCNGKGFTIRRVK